MAINIAEYLGQRTDSHEQIIPMPILPEVRRDQSPRCPFNNQPCMKMRASSNPKQPICSLRKTKGTYYVVCENRLISTDIRDISDYQRKMLLMAGQHLFNPTIRPNQLAYKAEVGIQTQEKVAGNHNHIADFILAVVDPELATYSARRILTEVQGGGETSSTGSITRHVENWEADANPNNEMLRKSIKKTGTIETNAWRRLQEQLFAKATTANKSGYGFATLLGEVVFDYLSKMIPDLNSIRSQPHDAWDVAFIVYKERPLQAGESPVGSVDFIVDPEKTFYTKLPKLLYQMSLRGQSDRAAFAGAFTTLDGASVNLSE